MKTVCLILFSLLTVNILIQGFSDTEDRTRVRESREPDPFVHRYNTHLVYLCQVHRSLTIWPGFRSVLDSGWLLVYLLESWPRRFRKIVDTVNCLGGGQFRTPLKSGSIVGLTLDTNCLCGSLQWESNDRVSLRLCHLRTTEFDDLRP